MESYQVATPADRRELSEFLVKEGQFLLPMVKLIEEARAEIGQVIDVTGRACIEALLELSAIERAGGGRSPGKRGGEVRWHGKQDGVVHLGERKLRVSKPRLRHKRDGEVEIPACAALRTRAKLSDRMMRILIDGVSTRRYRRVLPAMADTVGISKSAVSRGNIEAGAKLLEELAERRFDDKELLVIYIDGFTINAMGLPQKLMRCLASTNVIESANWGARQRLGRVTNWQDGSMALRWAACAFEATSQNFRRVMGHQQMWVLKAHLDEKEEGQVVAERRRAS